MKYWIRSSLFFLCGILGTLTFEKTTRQIKRSKAKKSSQIVGMKIPPKLRLDKIHGPHANEICDQILDFPMSSYQLFRIPEGYFYLDDVDDIIKNPLKKGNSWEPHIQKLISLYAQPDSTVLDIGAHIGTHTLSMSHSVGPKGRVLAFEPQPKTFRELFLNMTINGADNVSFYWAGVGDKDGTICLNPLSRGNEGGTGLGGSQGPTVDLLRIDSLDLSNVSLMKIDVEGMEEKVLDGAKSTIVSNRPVILIEILGGNDFNTASREIRHRILHVVEKLEDMNYKVNRIDCHDWIAIPLEKI